MKLHIKYFRRGKGLAYKLILFIFTSIAIIFSIAFLYTYSISRKIVEKNLKQNAENLTIAAVSKVDKVLNSVQKISDNFSKIIESRDYSREELIIILRQIVENNPEIYGAGLMFEPYYLDSSLKYNTLYVYRRDKKIEFKTFDENVDYFTMDYYQIPKELERSVWSQPYFDVGVGNVVMTTYSVPLYKYKNSGKQLVGVLGVDLSLDWLQEYLNTIKVYQTGYAFLISSIGTIVSHPIKNVIMNETIFSIADAQKSQQLRDIGYNMIHGGKSFAEIEYHNLRTGKLSWIAYAPIPTNNWSIGIVFPVNEFMADVNNLYLYLIFIGFGGLTIILILIILISRSITSPLRLLTQAAGKFAQGDFNVVLPSIQSDDEIGKLNASFIYMQNALASTINNLRETSSELKISNDKLEEYSRTLEQKVDTRTSELQEKNKELDMAFTNVRTLSEIGKKITSTLNIEIIEEMVYEHVNSLLDATTFLIMIYNEKERKLECKLSMEKNEKLPPFEISMDEKNRFAVWCVDNASPVFMNDVENEYMRYVPNRAKPKAGESVSSLIYLPLMIENRILGVVSAQSFQKNVYSQYQFDMLSNLANFIAIALDNALAYEKINKANNELKAAQAQLVQSEKMASLGQLTAGIAHEIKNPLNFINNFAEITVDLTKELSEELIRLSDMLQEKDKEYLLEMTNDIRSNAKKINEHGKRADSIVKGMLLHSRGKTDEKQPTDINAVLAEYVNLGYHGMRALNTGFNIKIDAEYDRTIGLINVAPQDLSRVFLNIINNACYSTQEKKEQLKNAYFPILTIRTKNADGMVEIRIRDNGKGIPREILDKIFNPFFTTKPPGHGTGLGLSLSYDIVVQEHHGELKVESKEGEFAEFIIIIPRNLN
jgi:signal transduction histidine kinase